MKNYYTTIVRDNDNKAILRIIVLVIFSSSSFFCGAQSKSEPKKVKQTENGIIIYEGAGVEGHVSNTPLKTVENEHLPKPISEYNLIECENSISDINQKIAALKYDISEQNRVKAYESYKLELIQRKQFLLGQTTTK